MTPDTQVNSVAPGLVPTQFADFITKDETLFQIVNQSSTWVKFAYKPHFELSLTVEKMTYYLTGLLEIRYVLPNMQSATSTSPHTPLVAEEVCLVEDAISSISIVRPRNSLLGLFKTNFSIFHHSVIDPCREVQK